MKSIAIFIVTLLTSALSANVYAHGIGHSDLAHSSWVSGLLHMLHHSPALIYLIVAVTLGLGLLVRSKRYK